MSYDDRRRADDSQEHQHRILNVRLNLSLHHSIQQIATKNGDTVAATVRALLRHSVEQGAK